MLLTFTSCHVAPHARTFVPHDICLIGALPHDMCSAAHRSQLTLSTGRVISTENSRVAFCRSFRRDTIFACVASALPSTRPPARPSAFLSVRWCCMFQVRYVRGKGPFCRVYCVGVVCVMLDCLCGASALALFLSLYKSWDKWCC